MCSGPSENGEFLEFVEDGSEVFMNKCFLNIGSNMVMQINALCPFKACKGEVMSPGWVSEKEFAAYVSYDVKNYFGVEAYPIPKLLRGPKCGVYVILVCWVLRMLEIDSVDPSSEDRPLIN